MSKYKVGQRVEWDCRSSCGAGIVRKVMELEGTVFYRVGPSRYWVEESVITKVVEGNVEGGLRPLEDLVAWLEYRRVSGYVAARQSREQEELWSDELKNLLSKKPSEQVLDGLSFLFDIAETQDTCYASESEKAALRAAGEWFRNVREKQ